MRRSANRRSAFTLLEVLLVLLIIGLLVGLVAPQLFGLREKAKVDAARGQIGLLRNACEYFAVHMNDYPASLQQLVENPGQGANWNGPYIDRIPRDPWKHDYMYEPQAGAKPVIFSAGPDGQPNTTDDVRDEEVQ